MLLPPKVLGPVNDLSSAVRVLGAVEGASVQLLANGAPLGAALPAGPLETVFPVANLAPGTRLAATQTTAAGASAPSPLEETVLAAPRTPGTITPLVVLSGVHHCIDWLLVGGAVPGAAIHALYGGQEVGFTIATGPHASIPVAFPNGANQGDMIEVWQEVAGQNGPVSPSLPFEGFPRGEPPRPALQPPFECDLAVLVTGLSEGLSLSLDHAGDILSGYPFMGTPIWAQLARPVRTGETIAVSQETQTCGASSGFGPQNGVNPAPKLPTPAIDGPVCPNAPMLRVRNLRPGARVTLYVVRKQLNGGAGALIGETTAWAEICEFPLPPGWSDHPQVAVPGLLGIEAFQNNCGKGSDTAHREVLPRAGLVGTPRAERPVECARLVAGRDLTPGAVVWVETDAADGSPISAPFTVGAREMAIPLYRPLGRGEKIRIRQSGCNADAVSADQQVEALAAVPPPQVQEPIRLPHGGCTLRDLLPGARVHVFVQEEWRFALDATGETMFVPIPGLEDRGMNVYARQAICTAISDESNHALTDLGEMDVSVSPSGAITRGRPVAITVTATDREFGWPVMAQVVIGGQIVGQTGAAFTHTFPLAQPAPASRVHADLYEDVALQWTLVDPPPPASPKPVRVSLSNGAAAYFELLSVTWSLEKQAPDGTLTPVDSQTGTSATLQPSGDGQYHLSAFVAVKDKATDEDVQAEFRGNATYNGQNKMIFGWTSTSDLFYPFRLVAESRTNPQSLLTYTNPVVILI